MWLKKAGFVERVRARWNSYAFLGSPSFVLDSKLKALKKDLKLWNQEILIFGDLNFRKYALMGDLSLLEQLVG